MFFADLCVNVEIENDHRRIAYSFGVNKFGFVVDKFFDCFGVVVGSDKSRFYAVFAQSYVEQIKRSAVNCV